jgi:hypothetical protein
MDKSTSDTCRVPADRALYQAPDRAVQLLRGYL